LNAKIILAPVLLLITFTALAADTIYYRWVDGSGVAQFSDEKPKLEQAEKVGPSQHFGYPLPPKTDNQPAVSIIQESSNATGNQAVPTQSPESTEENQRKNVAGIKKTNCAIGHRNLQQLQAYQRIKIKTPQGKVRTLSRIEKTAALNRANKLIRGNC
jgi:hypothetical protein